jgi:PAS domain S-box-containing protein
LQTEFWYGKEGSRYGGEKKNRFMEDKEPPHKDLEALPKSREIYRALAAYSSDAVLAVNHKGTIIFWNKGAERAFGYSSAEMVGRPVTALITERHSQSHTATLRAFLSGKGGDTAVIEGEALRKDGSTFPIELALSTQQRNGKFWAFAVARNIAQRRRTAQALRTSAERYCSLLAACLEAVFSVDNADNTGASDRALDRLGGYCLKELAVMKPENALSPEKRAYVSRQVERILSADEPVSGIMHEILTDDGERILMEQYLNSIDRTDETAATRGLHGGVTESSIGERAKSRLLGLTRIVSRVVESCDPYTAGHQQRVAELMCLVGENMGLAEDVVERLHLEGLLHDIGKVSIPRSILTKPGELAGEEWALIRAHTKQGYSILKDADLPWPIADVAVQHHERLDGSGYPDGITGDKLGLEVSILAVCDVVEAMSSHRPYRPARAAIDVLKELKDGRGTKYDASVVDVMLPMIESGEFRAVWNRRNSNSTAA